MSSGVDTLTHNPLRRVFPFPCYVTSEFKYKFDLPDRRTEVQWRTTDAPTGDKTPTFPA